MGVLTDKDYLEFLKLKISREIVDRAGVFRVTRDEAEVNLGVRLDCDGGVCFPVFLPALNGNNTTHAVAYSVRQDDPIYDADGKAERKYVTTPGRQYPYVAPVNPEWFPDPTVPVLLSESQKSALALLRWAESHDRRFIPIAINGCYGWRGKTGIEPDADGERKEVKGLNPGLAALCQGHRVYILLDANAATNPHVKHGRAWLAETLLQDKITTDIRILSLPTPVGAVRWNGPDDFLSVTTDADFDEVFESSQRFRLSEPEKSAAPRVWDSRTFLAETFPPREPFVVINGFNTPVFTARSINQLFAKRGTGKSMLSQAFAGIASVGGDFLNWKVLRPVRVLYVDGELPDAQIQQRMRELHPPGASINLVTLDSTPGGIPSLATAEGQAWLEKGLDGVELLILDSLATLAPFATNDEMLWTPLSSWLIRLRSRGLCILLLHQAGKLGLQRGHSRGDDALDVQIKLQPKEDEESDHLVCELSYEKFRAHRAGARTLNVEYSNGAWKWSQLEADKMKMLEEYQCLHPNASSRTIAKDLPELGSYRTIQKLLKKQS